MAENASQVLNIGDAQIAAMVDGCDGAPWLTLLHALATDHRLWDLQVAALSERFRVLRLDMRGHGASSTGVSGAIDLARLAADVRGVWDSLGIHRSSIMGLSVGGMIALELALDHGDRVERMVVADCRADAPPEFRAMWDARDDILRSGGLEAVAEATLPTWLNEATLNGEPETLAGVRDMILATSRSGYLGTTQALRQLNLLPRLHAIAVPTLFVVGADDTAMVPAMKAMTAAVFGSRFIEIEGAAHLANIERPREFAAATLPFLCGM